LDENKQKKSKKRYNYAIKKLLSYSLSYIISNSQIQEQDTMIDQQLTLELSNNHSHKKTKLKPAFEHIQSVSTNEIDNVVDKIMDTLYNPEKQQYYKRKTQIRQEFEGCLEYEMMDSETEKNCMIDMDSLGIDLESYNVNENEFIDSFKKGME
jgi:hypothetical protein